MRIVLDTNVLVAAFIAHGTCAELFEHCMLKHDVYLSAPLLDELSGVLQRTFRWPPAETASTVRVLRGKCIMVEPAHLPAPACRDADDDLVIGTAVAGKCQTIVTGDQDLLVLRNYGSVAIVSPAAFWKLAV